MKGWQSEKIQSFKDKTLNKIDNTDVMDLTRYCFSLFLTENIQNIGLVHVTSKAEDFQL